MNQKHISRKAKNAGMLKNDQGNQVPVPLNFRVPSDFRRDFKVYAAQRGIPMNELVQRAFEALKEKNRV